MKNFCIVFLLLATTLDSFSQKIDLDRLYFNITYRKLPENPVGPGNRTYKVNATTNPENLGDGVSDQFSLAGFRKDNGTPSFSVNFKFGNLFIDKTTVVERIDIKKDKDGKETGRTYYYKLEVLYNLTAGYKVDTKDGKSITNQQTQISKSFNTQEYTNRNDPQNYWNNNIRSLKNKFTEDAIIEYVKSTNNYLNDLIAYPEKKETRQLWTTDSPKHPENEQFKEACNITSQKLGMIRAQEPVNNIFAELALQIIYFESVIDKYKADEKPDKKLRYGSFYNRAMIYLMTDQPEKANEMADLLIANDYDKADGRAIKTEAMKIRSWFDANKMNTTHFTDEFLDTVK